MAGTPRELQLNGRPLVPAMSSQRETSWFGSVWFHGKDLESQKISQTANLPFDFACFVGKMSHHDGQIQEIHGHRTQQTYHINPHRIRISGAMALAKDDLLAKLADALPKRGCCMKHLG